jgi:D-inositol-3-phosphate glycosyltransferase
MARSGDVEFNVFSRAVRPGSSWMKEHVPMPASSGLPVIDVFDAPFRARKAFKAAVERIKPDLVHVHTPALVPPKGAPSLVTVHGTYYLDVKNLAGYPLSPGYKAFLSSLIFTQYRFERYALRYFDWFHPVSSMTAEELKHMGAPGDRICMVPNGVDSGEFCSAPVPDSLFAKYGLPRERLILSVGTVTPRKGAHVAVSAAADVLKSHPGATFVFAGAWPKMGRSYVEIMKKRAEKAGISGNIRFLGPVPQDDLKMLYNACSLFLSASITEGCSLNILEAAACGKPVVSTDVGGARDVLADMGRYAPINDHGALAARINETLDAGKTYLPELRDRIAGQFSWEAISREMNGVYRKASGR